MSLQNYWINECDDKFEAEENNGELCFPCCHCKHRTKDERDEPCSKCGHNANAELEEENKQ